MNEFNSLIWDNVDFLPKRKQNACSLIRVGHFHVGRDGPNSKGNPTHNITSTQHHSTSA